VSRAIEGEACVEDKKEDARAQQKRNSGAHSRMHSRTHKNTPTIAHAHTIPARKDGGEDSGYLLV
jgi:hypothetical protein